MPVLLMLIFLRYTPLLMILITLSRCHAAAATAPLKADATLILAPASRRRCACRRRRHSCCLRCHFIIDAYFSLRQLRCHQPHTLRMMRAAAAILRCLLIRWLRRHYAMLILCAICHFIIRVMPTDTPP